MLPSSGRDSVGITCRLALYETRVQRPQYITTLNSHVTVDLNSGVMWPPVSFSFLVNQYFPLSVSRGMALNTTVPMSLAAPQLLT